MDAKAAVAAIEAMDGEDPEADHWEADKILLALVPAEVREAYEALIERAGWWATA